MLNFMKSKKPPLSQTNPHLRDPANRKRLIRRSVVTSCAVEGIKLNLDKKFPKKPEDEK